VFPANLGLVPAHSIGVPYEFDRTGAAIAYCGSGRQFNGNITKMFWFLDSAIGLQTCL
jgi:hypothetical protein